MWMVSGNSGLAADEFVGATTVEIQVTQLFPPAITEINNESRYSEITQAYLADNFTALNELFQTLITSENRTEEIERVNNIIGAGGTITETIEATTRRSEFDGIDTTTTEIVFSTVLTYTYEPFTFASTSEASETYVKVVAVDTTVERTINTVGTITDTREVGDTTETYTVETAVTTTTTISWVTTETEEGTTTLRDVSTYTDYLGGNKPQTVYHAEDCNKLYGAGVVPAGYMPFCEAYALLGDAFTLLPSYDTTNISEEINPPATVNATITYISNRTVVNDTTAEDTETGYAPATVEQSLNFVGWWQPVGGYRPYTNLDKSSPIYDGYIINVAATATEVTSRYVGERVTHGDITEIIAHSDDTLLMGNVLTGAELSFFTSDFVGGGFDWFDVGETLFYSAGYFTQYETDQFGNTNSEVIIVDSTETFSFDIGFGPFTVTGRSQIAEEGVMYRWEYPRSLIVAGPDYFTMPVTQTLLEEIPCFNF